MLRSALACLATAFLLSIPAAGRAEVVSFDELPPTNDASAFLSDEYSDLGVYFFRAGAVWGGMSMGDPGGWGLEGTLGSAFLGMENRRRNLEMLFDWPVSGVSFDMARSQPGSDAAMLVYGYRDGEVVDRVSVPFPGAANEWVRVQMSDSVEVDYVVAVALISVPYGIDRLSWSGPLGDGPSEIEVAIDVRPEGEDNPVQVGSYGVLPVVLFGSEEFDVESVDPDTLGFGPLGAALAHANGPHAVDHDGDGHGDWVMHFRIDETGIEMGDVEACLVGETWDGMPVVGCDAVTPVGASKERPARSR